MSSHRLGEKKDTFQQTNNIVRDIVSIEPMIKLVTDQAKDLHQSEPLQEISTKYQTLTQQALELCQKQKEAIESHQSFIDAAHAFSDWLRVARERLGKLSDTTGDKETLSGRMSQLTV